jgi:site-specific recombinase XerC
MNNATERYLTKPEQRELLNAAKSQACPLAQRDYHWMATLILTGMRITEFSRLTVPMVRQAIATGWLFSKKEDCKGRREENSYCITIQLYHHLKALIKISDDQAQGMLFGVQPLVWGRTGRAGALTPLEKISLDAGFDFEPSASASALSVRSYEARLKHWAVAANLDSRISPHWLRHTLAMNIMDTHRGDDALLVIKRALNHRSLSSTQIYTHMNREYFAESMQVVASSSGRMHKADAKRAAQGARA